MTDPAAKKRIRAGAEEEERAFYGGRAPQEWLDALAPLGTNEHKPFLETVPCLIAIFAESYGLLPDGRKVKNSYVQESVGIAAGLLIMALHHAGLATHRRFVRLQSTGPGAQFVVRNEHAGANDQCREPTKQLRT